MSDPTTPYVIKRRDNNDSLEQIKLAGVVYLASGANTDRGRLYASLTKSGVTVTLNLYKDDALAAGDLVTSGSVTDADGATITLTEDNTSGLTGSVILRDYVADDTDLILYAALADDQDLDEIEANLSNLYLNSETHFGNIHQRVLRDLHTTLTRRLPPRVTYRYQVQLINHPFRENLKGDFEIARLQNVEAYRDWAVYKALSIIFRSQRAAFDGDMFALGSAYEERADKLMAQIVPILDTDSDGDAEVIVTGTPFKRG